MPKENIYLYNFYIVLVKEHQKRLLYLTEIIKKLSLASEIYK